MMISAKTALQHGSKHVCSDCACKYYDLGKKGALCPKCGGQPAKRQLRSSGRPVKKSRRSTFGQYPQGPGSTSKSPAQCPQTPAPERTPGNDAELPERKPEL